MKTAAQLLLGALLLSGCAHGGPYGAVAYSPSTGSNGVTRSYGSSTAAEEGAMRSCAGEGCRVVASRGFGCSAVAVGARRGWGSATAGTREEAETEARKSCDRVDRTCQIAAWTCDTPPSALPPTLAPSAGTFGAIAYSAATGSSGSSWNHGTKEAAEEYAMHECIDGNCVLIQSHAEGCSALAVGEHGGWGSASESSRDRAEKEALRSCQNLGRRCRVRAWACN
jgi:hypothetical protein